MGCFSAESVYKLRTMGGEKEGFRLKIAVHKKASARKYIGDLEHFYSPFWGKAYCVDSPATLSKQAKKNFKIKFSEVIEASVKS